MTRRRASGQRRATPRAHLERLSEVHGLFHPAPDEVDDADAPLHDAVRDAVGSALTGRQREVVELYFFEGVSQGAIAARLGVTQQVVHKCLYGVTRRGRSIGGALARLRAALLPLWEQAAGAASSAAS